VEDVTTRESLEARLAEMEHELVALRAQVAATEAAQGLKEPAMTGARTSRRRTGLGLVAATVGAAAVVTVGVGTALLDGPLDLAAALAISGSMALAVAGLLTTRHFPSYSSTP
jgi:hypothetical protein